MIKKIRPTERCPRFYGFCYSDFVTDYCYVAIVPFNILIRWVNRIYNWMVFGGGVTRFERNLAEFDSLKNKVAWLNGIYEGERQSRAEEKIALKRFSDALNDFERTIELFKVKL